MPDFLSAQVYAVVGVSRKPHKFGYKIYQYLKKVYPIHPAMTEIDGDICYKTLSDVPDKIEAVDIVVLPQVLPGESVELMKIKARPSLRGSLSDCGNLITICYFRYCLVKALMAMMLY